MASWPTVYDRANAPHDSADYLNIVYVKGSHVSQFDVMDLLRAYGPTSSRWLDDFYRVV